jgi:hypothetical protein
MVILKDYNDSKEEIAKVLTKAQSSTLQWQKEQEAEGSIVRSELIKVNETKETLKSVMQ